MKKMMTASRLAGLGIIWLILFNYPFPQAFTGWRPFGLPGWWVGIILIWFAMIFISFWIIESEDFKKKKR